MKVANLCTTCGEDFASVTAFDKHRVGKYPQTGPAEYTELLARRLVEADAEWRLEPRFGRRCLTSDEMQARDMTRDTQGRWRLAVRGTPPWTSDVRAETERKVRARPVRRPEPHRRRRRDTSPRSRS
jgi:hypothetical protein